VKILVTGGAGFIGSHLAEKLSLSGNEVTVIDSISNFLYGSEEKLENTAMFDELGIKFYKRDLVKEEIDDLVENQDVVINEAAIPGLVKSWEYINEYMASNVIAVGRLLESCKKNRVGKVIQVSTSSVYGKSALGDESSRVEPYSPYGVSKLASENLCHAYSKNFQIPIVILRYFSVYGPRQRPDMAYNRFIRAILNDECIEIYGDGLQSRTNTFVSDIVDATISCTLTDLVDGETLNISGARSINLLEVIRILEEIIGKKAQIKFLPAKNGDQRETRGDFTKASRLIDFKPKIDFELGLLRQVEWQAQHSE
jgi:UDP-glucuronate 4-epimerase